MRIYKHNTNQRMISGCYEYTNKICKLALRSADKIIKTLAAGCMAIFLKFAVFGMATRAEGAEKIEPITIDIPSPVGERSFTEIINGVTSALMYLAIIVAPILIIWGAYQIMSGNVEKVKKGRQAIVWAVVGLAIILSAKGIAFVVRDILGAKP